MFSLFIPSFKDCSLYPPFSLSLSISLLYNNERSRSLLSSLSALSPTQQRSARFSSCFLDVTDRVSTLWWLPLKWRHALPPRQPVLDALVFEVGVEVGVVVRTILADAGLVVGLSEGGNTACFDTTHTSRPE